MRPSSDNWKKPCVLEALYLTCEETPDTGD